MKSIEQIYEEKLQELIRLGEIKVEDSIASLSSKPSPPSESLKDKAKDTAQDILEDHDGKMKKTDLKEKTKQELEDNGDLENTSDSDADKAIDDAIQELEDEGELKSDDKDNVTSSDKEEEPEDEGEKSEVKGDKDKEEESEDEEDESDTGKGDKDKEPEDEEKEEDSDTGKGNKEPEDKDKKDGKKKKTVIDYKQLIRNRLKQDGPTTIDRLEFIITTEADTLEQMDLSGGANIV